MKRAVPHLERLAARNHGKSAATAPFSVQSYAVSGRFLSVSDPCSVVSEKQREVRWQRLERTAGITRGAQARIEMSDGSRLKRSVGDDREVGWQS